MESLGYMFLYFLSGSLPWRGLKDRTEDERNEITKEKKMELPGEMLCEGLPGEFATYINYTRSLCIEDKPDYSYFRQLFRGLFSSRLGGAEQRSEWRRQRPPRPLLPLHYANPEHPQLHTEALGQ